MQRKITIIVAVAVAVAAIAAGVIFTTGALTLTQQNNVNDEGNNINNTAQTTERDGNDKLEVIASFFPIYDFAHHVGGDRAQVSSLIPVGIEPHDWEPTAQNIVALQNADMFIFNGAGFEGEWITQIETNLKVDTSTGIQLLEGGEDEAH